MIVRTLWRGLETLAPVDRLWRLVAAHGIVVFVGPNGSGKSLAAVASVLDVLEGVEWTCLDPAHAHHAPFREHRGSCSTCEAVTDAQLLRRSSGELDTGLCDVGWKLLDAHSTGLRLVYSTVALLGEDGEDHPLYRPLIDYRQLLSVEHSEVLFDEVAGVSDASDSGSIPVQVVNWLHQLRKRDVRLRVTTPAYSRCSKPIRQVAQVVVDARSFAPERAVEGRLWRPRRGFVFTAYDAFAFEDFTAGNRDRLDPMTKACLWRPGHLAERTYNTLGQVLALGHVSESGMCMVCGGSRRRPVCKGHSPEEEDAARKLRVVEAEAS